MGDDDSPALTWDLLQWALPRFLAFETQRDLGATCRRLAATWKLAVRELPFYAYRAAETCDYQRLSDFRSLESLPYGYAWPPSVPLSGVSRLTCLQRLRIYANAAIAHSDLVPLVSVTRLELMGSSGLCDSALAPLTALRTLRLHHPSDITDAALCRLSGSLTSLSLEHMTGITDGAVSTLTRLRTFKLYHDRDISDASMYCLTALTKLAVHEPMRITADSLTRLASLTALDIADGSAITDALLPRFTGLRALRILERRVEGQHVVLGNTISRLTALTALSLHAILPEFTDRDLAQLTALTLLAVTRPNLMITGATLSRLTRLTRLNISGNPSVADEHVARLTSLRALTLHYNTRISDGSCRAPHVAGASRAYRQLPHHGRGHLSAQRAARHSKMASDTRCVLRPVARNRKSQRRTAARSSPTNSTAVLRVPVVSLHCAIMAGTCRDSSLRLLLLRVLARVRHAPRDLTPVAHTTAMSVLMGVT